MTLKSNLEKPIKSNRILLLSGSGVEGIAELAILAEIEVRTGKSVSELFPVITGSGVGGLIAALLTVPKSQEPTTAKYSAKESLEIFKEISASIFEYYKYRGMKPELKYRYRQKALKELLDKYIGNTHLGNATSRLIIPTTDLNTHSKDVKISEGYNLVDSNNYRDIKLRDMLLTTIATPMHVNSVQHLACEVLKKIQDKQYSNSKTENIERLYNFVVALNSDKETRTDEEIFRTINNTIIGEPDQQKLSNNHSTSAVELIENILNQGDVYSEIILPLSNDIEQINSATNKNILTLEEISRQYIVNHDKELTQLCQLLLGDLPRSQQVTAILDAQEKDEGYESDIDIPLERQVKKKINNQGVNNLAQSRKKVLLPENAIDKSQKNKSQEIFTGWEFTQGKTGGVNDAGAYGGVYKSTDGTKRAMIKKERNTSKNISEYLGSRLFNSISEGNGAQVSIIVPKMLEQELGSGIRSHNLDQEVYVKSEFFNNYSGDMYVDMDQYMSESKKPSKWFRKNGGRPLFMGSRNKLHGTLENAFKELDYQGFEDIMPASLLIGDFDIHLGNIGIIRDNDNNKSKPRMVRIDFAGSLRKLTDKIYPHSRLRHLPGFGPTNHYREFPSHLRRNNEALGIKLLEASKIDLSKTIDSSFKEISKYYSKDAIMSFAKASLPKQFAKNANTEVSISEIKEAFKSMISRRQESLQEYGMEVLLSTLVKKIAKAPYYEIDKHKLKALITDNMNYFVDRFIGVDKVTVKVSDKSLRGVFLAKKGVEKMLGQEISSILKEVIKDKKKSKLLLNQREVSNNKAYTTKQDNISSTQVKIAHTTNNHNLLDSSNQWQDMYIITNNVVASTQSNVQGTLITIVRNEILKKQRYQLSLYLSRYVELAQFIKDDRSFQDFLSNLNTKNKKLVDKALTNAKVKAELEHIELLGYQKMRSAFKGSCQDIRWSNTTNSHIGLQRSQIIKDGKHQVCTLIETTNNAASTILSKQDGTNVTVKKYRTISFPTRINYPVNTIDLAIVGLDEMGNRPDDSHAVYFIAHYEIGAGGKTILTEVSTPIPLKFQGDSKDAIGYVEHNGKIYTMPVTRGKYEEMMIEVAKNKGQGLNLSQTIDQEARDIVKVASMVNNRSLESEDYHKERLIHHANLSVAPKKQTDESINVTQINDLPYESVEHMAKIIGQNFKKVKKYNKSINCYSKATHINQKLNNDRRTR